MKKTFDSVKWVRQVRDEMYEETKNMSREQLLAFHRERAKQAFKKLGIKSKSKA